MTFIGAVCNGKGGVGKTFVSVNISAALAASGKKVCLIDLCPSRESTNYLDMTDVGSGTNDLNIFEAIRCELPFEYVMLPTKWKNFFLVRGSEKMSDLDSSLIGEPNQYTCVSEFLKSKVLKSFDFVIMDTAPNFTVTTGAALAAADGFFMPVFPEKSSVSGMSNQMMRISKIRKHANKNLEFMGLIINKFEKSSATHTEIIEIFNTISIGQGFKIFKPYLPNALKSVSTSSYKSEPIVFDKPHLPIGKNLQSLTNEIIKSVEEKLNKKKTGRPKKPIDHKAFAVLDRAFTSPENHNAE